MRTSNFLNKRDNSVGRRKEITSNLVNSPDKVHKELVKSSIKNYVKRNFSHNEETANQDILYMKEDNRTKKIVLNDNMEINFEPKRVEDNKKKLILSSFCKMENMFKNFMDTMTKRIDKIEDKIDSLENKVTSLRSNSSKTKKNHKVRRVNTIRLDTSNDFNTTHIQETDYLNNERSKPIQLNNINPNEINTSKKEDSESINMWKRVLNLVSKQEINSAYETVLNSGIRLINQMMISTYSGYCS